MHSTRRRPMALRRGQGACLLVVRLVGVLVKSSYYPLSNTSASHSIHTIVITTKGASMCPSSSQKKKVENSSKACSEVGVTLLRGGKGYL